MARTRRYRRYRRRSGKWSSNIDTILDQLSVPSNGQFGYSVVLARNPTTNSSTTISQIFTVKNFELTTSFDTAQQPDLFENLVVYIMYVPEILDPNSLPSNFPQLHPEYVMTYKYVGSPSADSGQGFQPIRVKSRLAKKLNSGDRVIAFFQGYRTGTLTVPTTVDISGLVRYWTKAN